ncbi:hypothetical protein ACLOJK_011591 [Asimina triloba]
MCTIFLYIIITPKSHCRYSRFNAPPAYLIRYSIFPKLPANPSPATIITADPNLSKEHRQHPHSRSGSRSTISFKSDRLGNGSDGIRRLPHLRELDGEQSSKKICDISFFLAFDGTMDRSVASSSGRPRSGKGIQIKKITVTKSEALSDNTFGPCSSGVSLFIVNDKRIRS